jgi:hypothetical protein
VANRNKAHPFIYSDPPASIIIVARTPSDGYSSAVDTDMQKKQPDDATR